MSRSGLWPYLYTLTYCLLPRHLLPYIHNLDRNHESSSEAINASKVVKKTSCSEWKRGSIYHSCIKSPLPPLGAPLSFLSTRNHFSFTVLYILHEDHRWCFSERLVIICSNRKYIYIYIYMPTTMLPPHLLATTTLNQVSKPSIHSLSFCCWFRIESLV